MNISNLEPDHLMFCQLSQHDLHHKIATEVHPTLVFFGAIGCASCRHLKQVLEQVMQRQPQWRIFEVDAQQEMGLVREFEVFHLPALFLFSAGEFHAELHCEARCQAIEQAVEQALALPAQDAP